MSHAEAVGGKLFTRPFRWLIAFLALWGALVVGMVDNFLRPILISGRAEVPTLAVFVGVMGGLSGLRTGVRHPAATPREGDG